VNPDTGADGSRPAPEETSSTSLSKGDHFSCSLTSTLITTLREEGGEEAVQEVLRRSGCTRTLEHLQEAGNWISFEEAIALIDAGEAVTGDPLFARRLGEAAIPTVKGSPLTQMLRSLGSVEEAYRRTAITGTKLGRVSNVEVRELRAGYAEIVVSPRPGFPRARQHCEWTRGLMTQPPLAFGLPPATVEHPECTAKGDAACLYRITWNTAPAEDTETTNDSEADALREQLGVMTDRVDRLFATATDLIDSEELEVTLARITERAAHELRNPRCLLLVRPHPGEDAHCHHRGLDGAEASQITERLLAERPDLPPSWVVAPVRSRRRDYGWLVSVNDAGGLHFPQEQRLLSGFAGYAAAALDLSIALAESRRRHAETTALLDFARSLASASRDEVAGRLAEAIPHLVDCDRVCVYVERHGDGHLRCAATYGYPEELARKAHELEIVRNEEDPALNRALFGQGQPKALFFDQSSPSPFVHRMYETFGSVALAYVPIIARGKVLGSIGIIVTSRPERLQETPELQNLLGGIAAQAAVGLENGELIDRISHQASHDPLTGLVNRRVFAERFEQTLAEAREAATPLGLFYVDLDRFKQVNDRHGHDVGDELLCQVAARLLGLIRSGDTVARLGGDEFAIILREVADRSQVETAAERVRQAFIEPFRIQNLLLDVGASVGRAIWPYDGDELPGLLRRADETMYEAKRSGARRPDPSIV